MEAFEFPDSRLGEISIKSNQMSFDITALLLFTSNFEKLIQNEVKQEDPKKHYKEISKRYSPWHAFNLCRELYGDKSNFI